MAKLSKVEDRPTPKEVYNWKIYANSIYATMAAIMIGYDSAFIGTSISLASFKSEFSLTNASTTEFDLISANIVSMYQAGCFFGAIFAYPIGYFLGRRLGLMFSGAVFIIGAGLQCGANASTGLGILYAGRVIAGLAIGSASNLAPIYVAEIAPASIRGRLVGLYELCWQIGGVTGFFINYGVSLHVPSSHKQWVISFMIQFIPGGLLLLTSFIMIESPRWLVSRDRNEEALKNLANLRGLPVHAPYVVEEFSETVAGIAHERQLAGAGFLGPLKTVFLSRALKWRLFLGISLFAWQNATGINAINYYSPTVFKSIGVTGQNASLFTTGIFGIIKLVGALVWLMWLVDTLGRRNLLMLGSIGGAISMYYVGAYIAITKPSEHPTASLSSTGISAMFFFYLWTAFYSPSWNGTPWVVCAEMFPQHVRTFTQAAIAAANWLFAFLIARFTPQMFTSMGFGVYMFFATLMILSIPYIFFLLPETKQISLARMDELFADDVKPWNAHAIVMTRSQHAHHLGEKSTSSPASGSTRASLADKASESRVENV